MECTGKFFKAMLEDRDRHLYSAAPLREAFYGQ
jgi:hypothetical protein